MKQFSQAAICTFLLLLVFSITTLAQVEPDTVKRKRELPTGPPPGATPPRQQPTVIKQAPAPVVKQQEEKEELSLRDRLYFGGSFGLQFGTITNISLLPIIGYKVTDKWNVGTGVVYHYIKSGNVSLNNYGGRAFTQYELFNIFEGAVLAHVETEVLSSEYFTFDRSGRYMGNARRIIPLPLAGLGYRQRISDRASFDMLLLYNFSKDDANPYNNPVIRAGFNIPFPR
jgi:hypothetical protein